MDLVSALRIALRRWKIAVSVLVLAVLGAVLAYLGAGTVYSAKNYVVVVPSSVSSAPGTPVPGAAADPAVSASDQAQRNALVNAGGARLISNLLVTNLNSAAVRTRFGDGQDAGYTVTADAQLPVVTVTVNGSDQRAVTALLGRVIDGADSVLNTLQAQAGIPPSTTYRAPRFAPDPVVTSTSPNRTRVVVAILAAGVALAIVLAVVLDGPLSRRESNRRTDSPSNQEPLDPGPDEDRSSGQHEHLSGATVDVAWSDGDRAGAEPAPPPPTVAKPVPRPSDDSAADTQRLRAPYYRPNPNR